MKYFNNIFFRNFLEKFLTCFLVFFYNKIFNNKMCKFLYNEIF